MNKGKHIFKKILFGISLIGYVLIGIYNIAFLALNGAKLVDGLPSGDFKQYFSADKSGAVMLFVCSLYAAFGFCVVLAWLYRKKRLKAVLHLSVVPAIAILFFAMEYLPASVSIVIYWLVPIIEALSVVYFVKSAIWKKGELI